MQKVHTFFPCQQWMRFYFRWLWQMDTTGEVKPYSLGISSSLPENGSSMVSHAHSSTIEEGLLGIVCHAVIDDEIEVILKLIQAFVFMPINAFPHGREVHWMFDVIEIVWNLMDNTVPKEICNININ